MGRKSDTREIISFLKYNRCFLSPAHEVGTVGVGDIVIIMSGRAAVRPSFVFGRYL